MHEGVQVDTSILLTARLTVGQYSTIYPLTGPALPRLPQGIPSFSSFKQASIVRLKEITDGQSKTTPWIAGATSSVENGMKREDWLDLLLREMLGMSVELWNSSSSTISQSI